MNITPWKEEYTISGRTYKKVKGKKDPLFGSYGYYESEDGYVLFPSLHDKISHRAKQIRSITMWRLKNPYRFNKCLRKKGGRPLHTRCI